MQKRSISRLALTIAAASAVPYVHAEAGGFMEDATATLQARNYHFSRDFSDIEGPSQQSKAEEWGQGSFSTSSPAIRRARLG